MDEGAKLASGSYQRVEAIAKLFGITVRRIQQLTQEGILHTVETPNGNRYDLITTVQEYIKYLSDKAYGRSRSEKENELREQKLRAEIALKESQGELHQLKTAIARGDYISVEEATLDYTRFFVVFKKFALSLPSRLAGIVAAYLNPVEVRHIEKDLSGEVQKQLTAFVVAGITEPPKKRRRTKQSTAQTEGGDDSEKNDTTSIPQVSDN